MPIKKHSATCAALIFRRKPLADSRGRPLLASMTKSHKTINTTCTTKDAGNSWRCSPCRAGVAAVFRQPGEDTFQLGIELVDNCPLLRIGASDVDGFRGKIAARAFILFLSVSMRRVAFEPDKARKATGGVLTVMSRNIHRMSPKTKCAGGISGDMAGSNEREPIQFLAHRRSHNQSRGIQMTKMKTLSAVIILSAAIATPVFAQDASVLRPQHSQIGRASCRERV